MAIALVQKTHGSQASSTGTTVAATFGSNTTTGNLIVVGTANSISANAVTSVTDGTNTYVKATSSGTNAQVEVWYAKNIVGDTTPTVTVNYPSASAVIFIAEYSGIDQPSPLDKVKAAASGANPATTGASATISQPTELLFAVAANNVGSTYTVGTNYGNFQSDSGSIFVNGASEDQIVSIATTYAGTFGNASAASSDVCLATFKGATTMTIKSNRGLRPYAFSPGLAR